VRIGKETEVVTVEPIEDPVEPVEVPEPTEVPEPIER
jgi:hypothetical protein